MSPARSPAVAVDPTPALEETLSAVEQRLSGLGEALRQRDLAEIDSQSAELHRALARAVDHFTRAARQGPIPPALRLRLASTSGHVAAQRESFARATAALDRAIDVLLPRDAPAVYGAYAGAGRSLGGSIQA
ncbi:hypothetical protein [Piscinibacter sakaiensis]|uniref:hypothetical protein n=1 Tax=Piscinibacter sakaiensis TaxID=1547922 RepID=UPI0012FBABE4|nr:hypothetical protein [Piscinibacter sakaiensis]